MCSVLGGIAFLAVTIMAEAITNHLAETFTRYCHMAVIVLAVDDIAFFRCFAAVMGAIRPQLNVIRGFL